jgi:hypothetical protein
MVIRVEDRGESERSDCNGRNTDCNIIRRESGQTSSWFPITRKLGKST